MTSRSDSELTSDPSMELVIELLRPGIGLLLSVLLEPPLQPPVGVWRRVSFDYCQHSNGSAQVVKIRVMPIGEDGA